MVNLFDKETAKFIVDKIQSEKPRLDLNAKLFNIYEGHVGDYLEEKMISDLSEGSYKEARERKCSINILKKVIDKLSKIYQQEPNREVLGGSKTDYKIVKNFEEILNIDHKLNVNNELMNLYKYSLLQLSLDVENRKPFIRTIPNHKFVVINLSKTNPTTPDIVCLLMDSVKDAHMDVDIYHIYTDDQFAVYDGNGKIRFDLMNELEQDGENPVGKKPFIYLNSSENLSMPKVQSDTFDITLLIPLLLTDINYIAKFSAFSILYGIDIDDKNMKRAPNTFWRFKSDVTTDKAPSIGTVKPEGDIDVLTKSAMDQFGLWLNTKGIKPSSIGDADNLASGVAKMIDEADITDSRTWQASLYTTFEKEFWDLLLKYWYPFWLDQGFVDNIGVFNPNSKVIPRFKPQTPLQDRGKLVVDLKTEMEAGFLTQKRAIKILNPKMTDSEIDILIKEIEMEKPIPVVMNDAEAANKEQDTDENNDKDT